MIPAEDLAAIEAKAAFTVERTLEIEKTTNHDVVAFLTDVAEHVGPASRWVHYGMTSSDVLDTGLALAIAAGGRDLLLAEQAALTPTLRDGRCEHAETLCVGRTHGIHAEPTTFGLKLAGFAFESRRNEERLARRIAGASVGQALGRRRHLRDARPRTSKPRSAGRARHRRPSPSATQVVARDRHAELVCTMAVAASSLDRLATELRHLQRTELREAEEAFTEGQKGSSAMPHKRNPITAERISGSRASSAATRSPPSRTWRCGTSATSRHSSVERIILPDATILPGLPARHARGALVEGLVVSPGADARGARSRRTAWCSRSGSCWASSSAA